MPIRPDLRDLYPAHWKELSRRVRFERAGGVCEDCGRPHGGAGPAKREGCMMECERKRAPIRE